MVAVTGLTETGYVTHHPKGTQMSLTTTITKLGVVAFHADQYAEYKRATEGMRADRDAAIREAVLAGHSIREVAKAAGITHALVHRIAHRE